MRKRGVARAIVVGHSFGGATAAALAVRYPDMVSGLVLMSPAAYPWKGGVAWYYDVATVPVAGFLFSALLVPPIGLISLDRASLILRVLAGAQDMVNEVIEVTLDGADAVLTRYSLPEA